ncbi:sensor histidine kinase [Galbibacter mesophilus]|uniref:sensor histidine kinase n=1 Tax=Galbibacter mesophilus TaxID=379069 RepID=UPI001A92B500|nr:HAMP domain-containing sensor histidine kinase [Galbibacter mesophilus]MCM5662631.1 HAMP domain-containing histidine kinase [Galbibacter mesophilus]
MKREKRKVGLIQKTSRTFILVSFILMLLSTVILYFYIRSILQEEIEQDLYSRASRIESVIEMGADPFSLPPVVEIEQVSSKLPAFVKDTLIFDPSQDEMELFRELTTFKNVQGNFYRITVRDLVVESDDILIAFIVSYVFILIIVFVVLFYLNKVENSNIWQPFFHTLYQLKHFSVASKQPLIFKDSEIKEFSELNTQMKVLTDKVRKDYNNLKQFTEDVSHELQTPLSVMQVKIENMVNDGPLNDEQYRQLISLNNDIKRISQLNKGLALLTKIENNQFANLQKIELALIITRSIANFGEIFSKEIYFSGDRKLVVTMDYHLAEILCNNLIVNAIKHTSSNGHVEINITSNSFSVKNTGDHPIMDADKIFERFYKESQSANSTGLGLAIVKKICELYGFEIIYTFEKGFHVFKISF